MVVAVCQQVEKKELAEFLRLAEFGTFLLVAPEQAVLWTSGDYSWIECVKKVYKHPSTKFMTTVVMLQQAMKFVGAEY